MAEFPWAEAYPERAAEVAQEYNTRHRGFMQALGGLMGMPGRGGFAALRPNVERFREAMAVRRGAEGAKDMRLGTELEELLRKLGGRPGPSGISRPYSEATARIGRSPTGRPDLPSEELMPSLESPSGRGFSRLLRK